MDFPRTPPQRPKKRCPRTTPRKWTDKLVSNDRKQIGPASPSRVPPTPPTVASDDQSARSTPSAVLVSGYPMTRDLSDLSGSYLNGNTSPRVRSAGTAATDDQQSDTSYQRPWRLTHICSKSQLSLVANNSNNSSSSNFAHPQPPPDGDDSVVKDTTGGRKQGSPLRQQQKRDVVKSALLPLVVLLMDPARKHYELLQLPIDPVSTTVRDLLRLIKETLPDEWRLDYDGLFQWQQGQFRQLIHILNADKYQLKRNEVWIAKPWSMAAAAVMPYAEGLLAHLQRTGVVAQNCTLTSQAVSRICLSPSARGGKDSGATLPQSSPAFLSFVPPFEKQKNDSSSPLDDRMVRVDVLANDQASRLSDSHCGGASALVGDDEDDKRSRSHYTPQQMIVTTDNPPPKSSGNTQKKPSRKKKSILSALNCFKQNHHTDQKKTASKTREMLQVIAHEEEQDNERHGQHIPVWMQLEATVGEESSSSDENNHAWQDWRAGDAQSVLDASVVSESAPLLLRGSRRRPPKPPAPPVRAQQQQHSQQQRRR